MDYVSAISVGRTASMLSTALPLLHQLQLSHVTSVVDYMKVHVYSLLRCLVYLLNSCQLLSPRRLLSAFPLTCSIAPKVW
jgi:hypothetical protein